VLPDTSLRVFVSVPPLILIKEAVIKRAAKVCVAKVTPMSQAESPDPSVNPSSAGPASTDAQPLEASAVLALEADVLIRHREFPAACYMLVSAIKETDDSDRRREIALKLINLLLKTLW
jgi:hypothetical protein